MALEDLRNASTLLRLRAPTSSLTTLVMMVKIAR